MTDKMGFLYLAWCKGHALSSRLQMEPPVGIRNDSQKSQTYLRRAGEACHC